MLQTVPLPPEPGARAWDRDRSRLLGTIVLAQATGVAVYVLLALHQGGLVRAVCRWDCGWYGSIIAGGYDHAARLDPITYGQANWAFFPFYPLLGRLVAVATGLDALTSGILLNLAILPVLVWLSVLYGLQRRMIVHPLLAACVLFAIPYGLYLRSGYSEATYGLLLVAALLLVARQRPAWAAACLFLLGASRPTGLLMAIVIAGTHLAPAFRPAAWLDRPALVLRALQAAAMVGAAAGGLACYMIYLHGLTGDALAFSHVQRGWGRSFGNPLGHVLDGLTRADLGRLRFGEHSGVLAAATALAGVALVAWMALRGWVREAMVLLATLLLATSTGLEALPRFIFCNPLGMLAVAALLERLPGPARWPAVLLLALVQAWFVTLWYRHAAFLT